MIVKQQDAGAEADADADADAAAGAGAGADAEAAIATAARTRDGEAAARASGKWQKPLAAKSNTTHRKALRAAPRRARHLHLPHHRLLVVKGLPLLCLLDGL